MKISKETYIRRRAKLKKDVGSGLLLFLGNDEVGMNYLDNTRFKINELPPTGIDDIQLSRNTPKAGIYTIGGQLISTDCSEQTLHALPSGIYLINGKKVAVGK